MINQFSTSQDANTSKQNMKLATAIPILTIIVAPLGVAGQNIGLGLATACFLFLMARDKGQLLKFALRTQEIKQFVVLWSLVTLPIVTATIANGDSKDASRFFWGYVFICFSVVASVALRSATFHRKAIFNTVVVVATIMGLVSMSQMLLGWKIEGGAFASQIKRAQGFYSHPLTFAYAALVVMPWFTAKWMATPHKLTSWFLGLSSLIMVVTSQSVTVMAIYVGTCIVFAMILLSKKQIFKVLALCSLIAVGAWQIPNPLTQKIQTVLSGQRGDRETPYPDDRMAFWHAHWEMFLDAPVRGHGTGLESEDRRPYYDKIGLLQIKRPYEAHNMYLQYAVEGGFISVLAFIGFILWWLRRMKDGLTTSPWHRLALLATPIGFALGGLTQNAIQDSEVRFLLMIICSFSFWYMKPAANLQRTKWQ